MVTDNNGKAPKSGADIEVLSKNNSQSQNTKTPHSNTKTPHSNTKTPHSNTKTPHSSSNFFKNCLLWCGGVHWNCTYLIPESAKNRVPKALVSIIISSLDGSIIGVAAASIFPPLSGILIGVGISIGEISYNRHVFSKRRLSLRDILLRLIPGIAIASVTSLFLPIFMSNRVVEDTIKVEIEEQLIKTNQERKTKNKVLYKFDAKKSEETGNKEFYKDEAVQNDLNSINAKIKRLESKREDIENGNPSNNSKLSIEEKAKILFNSAFISELERSQAQSYENYRKQKYQNDSLNSNDLDLIDDRPRERRAWEKMQDVNFYRAWSIFWFVIALFIESTPMLMQIKTKDEEHDSYEDTVKRNELIASSITFLDYEADKIDKMKNHAPRMDKYVENAEKIANARVTVKRFENAEKDSRFVGDDALTLEQKHNYSNPLEDVALSRSKPDNTPTMSHGVDKPFNISNEDKNDFITNDFEDYQEVNSPNKSDAPQQSEQPMSLREQLKQWGEDNADYSSEEDNRDRAENTDPWIE